MRARRSTDRTNGGFTLLELLAAFVIFGLMASAVLVDLDRATSRALGAVRARELRVLAEERLGRITVFEGEYDDLFPRTPFDDLDDDRWDGWEWELDIRDIKVFESPGAASDEQVEYLFGPPDKAEEEEAAETTPGATQPRSDTQYLRELTLTVHSPEIDGESDSVTIITFLPLVDRSTAPAAGGGEGGGSGEGN